MLPIQTVDIILGVGVALLYAATVLATGGLVLRFLLGCPGRAALGAWVGQPGLVWCGFVIGQGVLGCLWLLLSLAGLLYAGVVWGVCLVGVSLGIGMLWTWRQETVTVFQGLLARVCCRRCSWYGWVGRGIALIVLLRGIIALLPPGVDDALWVYLPAAKSIAVRHTVEFQPFLSPHHGLYPLQVDMHWAALWTISNETAVTLWDYLCAVSCLSGVGLLAWVLTTNRQTAILAMFMMLSTPGLYELMGGAKPDNAATQYGLAAFVWLAVLPGVGPGSVIWAGVCAGWAVASRYTNVIALPALIAFFVLVTFYRSTADSYDKRVSDIKRGLVCALPLAMLAFVIVLVPMLLKNWLLVGCPVAPQFGCQAAFWVDLYNTSRQNISRMDVVFYPFIWTFAHRPDMLGNISPLFLGFLPLLPLTCRRLPLVRSAGIAGYAGLIALSTWLFIEPLILFTRWLLLPLALCAIPCSAAYVTIEREVRHGRAVRWLLRSTVLTLGIFLLFQSRAVVYAVRYITAIDSPAVHYASPPHFAYDVANWLNAHVQSGQRVALKSYIGHPYFINIDILWHTESSEELQWLWEHRQVLSRSMFWDFYVQHGFTYIVVGKEHIAEGKVVLPTSREFQVVFEGKNNIVLRVAKATSDAE
jgi:hypothetical protein